MKNKKRKTGEEIKEHKRRARGDKVSQLERYRCGSGHGYGLHVPNVSRNSAFHEALVLVPVSHN
jgi:hypothetical protein